MKRGFTLAELLITIAIVIILDAILLGVLGGGCTQSVGDRDGYITKKSAKGVIWTTYEATMMVGAPNSGQTWDFTVPSRDLWKELNNITAEDFVRIHYKEKMWGWWWNGDTSVYANSVVVLRSAASLPEAPNATCSMSTSAQRA